MLTRFLTIPSLGVALIFLSLGAKCRSADPPAPEMAVAVPDTLRLTFDYAGVDALTTALERDSLSETDVDSLLRVHGVRAMVNNVTRFVPGIGEPEFRRAVHSFANTKRPSDQDRYFGLNEVWRGRSTMRALIERLHSEEAAIQHRLLVQLAPYQPNTGPLAAGAYFVAGGVSTGFVPDDASGRMYANIVRAGDDYDGIVDNLAHEAYHIMQKAAQRRAGLGAFADSVESLPLPVRLLATTAAEGTAQYITEARGRDEGIPRAARVRQNFAVFDTVLAALRDGSLTWERAYARGFTSEEDERFYVIGQEMTRAIERKCGRACVAGVFAQHPVEFFRQYVRLYQEHPDIVGRFAPATEAFLAALATGSG